VRGRALDARERRVVLDVGRVAPARADALAERPAVRLRLHQPERGQLDLVDRRLVGARVGVVAGRARIGRLGALPRASGRDQDEALVRRRRLAGERVGERGGRGLVQPLRLGAGRAHVVVGVRDRRDTRVAPAAGARAREQRDRHPPCEHRRSSVDREDPAGPWSYSPAAGGAHPCTKCARTPTPGARMSRSVWGTCEADHDEPTADDVVTGWHDACPALVADGTSARAPNSSFRRQGGRWREWALHRPFTLSGVRRPSRRRRGPTAVSRPCGPACRWRRR
jgi:hypothetical protein